MDISKETSIEKLESLAYRQVVTIEQAQANLRVLQQRIAELSNEMALGGNKSDLAQIVNDATAEEPESTNATQRK